MLQKLLEIVNENDFESAILSFTFKETDISHAVAIFRCHNLIYVYDSSSSLKMRGLYTYIVLLLKYRELIIQDFITIELKDIHISSISPESYIDVDDNMCKYIFHNNTSLLDTLEYRDISLDAITDIISYYLKSNKLDIQILIHKLFPIYIYHLYTKISKDYYKYYFNFLDDFAARFEEIQLTEQDRYTLQSYMLYNFNNYEPINIDINKIYIEKISISHTITIKYEGHKFCIYNYGKTLDSYYTEDIERIHTLIQRYLRFINYYVVNYSKDQRDFPMLLKIYYITQVNTTQKKNLAYFIAAIQERCYDYIINITFDYDKEKNTLVPRAYITLIKKDTPVSVT